MQNRRAWRMAGPLGLVLAGLCLLLPFMTGSCASAEQQVQWRVTYTGADVVAGGRPAVDFTDDVNRESLHRLDDAEVDQLLGGRPERLPARPLGWLAAALMVAALAATALRSPLWRRTLTAGLALAAAITLWGATVLARRDATDAVAAVLSGTAGTGSSLRLGEHYDEVRDAFRYEYGLWLTIALLVAVAVAGIAGVIRSR